MRPLLTLATDLLNISPADDSEQAASRVRFHQCLLLAVLLHLWLVVVLGSAPGGNAPPGEGAYGSLSVRLQAPVAEPGLDAKEPVPDSGPVGQAPQRRFGGRVRPVDAPPRQDQPGAEITGNWRSMESRSDPNLPVPQPSVTEIAPLASTPVDTLPELPAATLVDTAPQVKPIQANAPSKIAPTQLPKFAPLPSTAYDTLRPAKVLNDVPQRMEPARLIAPGKLAPTPLPELGSVPSTALDALRPRSTATLETPNIAPPELPEPLNSPARLPSTQIPDLKALPKVELATPGPPASPSPSPSATAIPPAPGPSTTPSTTPSAQAGAGGSPNAGGQQGHDIATPPSATPGPKPLNLNLPLARGPMASNHGSSGMLPLVPKPPEVESEIEKAVNKGQRIDCRKAYGDQLGLLAAVPLAIDTARGKGCKW